MSAKCPAGHPSKASDYCDVCGAPMAAAPPAAAKVAAPAATGTQPCPHCAEENAKDALFCEACGYDFTTHQLPTVAASSLGTAPPTTGGAAAVEWVAEVWVDPDWYKHEAVSSTDPCPNAGVPRIVPLREATSLIGRTSNSRSIHPAVDCASDSAVSRQHAELTLEGGHWYVEDLRSVNGTYVGKAGAPLPDDPIVPGRRRALADDERVYVGAWTRLVIRAATAEERDS